MIFPALELSQLLFHSLFPLALAFVHFRVRRTCTLPHLVPLLIVLSLVIQSVLVFSQVVLKGVQLLLRGCGAAIIEWSLELLLLQRRSRRVFTLLVLVMLILSVLHCPRRGEYRIGTGCAGRD